MSTLRSTSILDPYIRGWKSCHKKFCLHFLGQMWFLPQSFNFEVSAVNHLSSLMSEQWRPVNHLSKVMGEQRKKGEKSYTAVALKQHPAFKNKHLWSLSSPIPFDKWFTDSENWQVMWQVVTEPRLMESSKYSWKSK